MVINEFNNMLKVNKLNFFKNFKHCHHIKNSPITDEATPPGAPTVDNAGPLLPALETKIIPCLSTISFMRLITHLRKYKNHY